VAAARDVQFEPRDLHRVDAEVLDVPAAAQEIDDRCERGDDPADRVYRQATAAGFGVRRRGDVGKRCN
jgi:hypothetical protein